MSAPDAGAGASAPGADAGTSAAAPLAVEIVVFDGVDELDAVGPYEVLVLAAALGANLSARLVTRAPAEEVRGNHGLVLRPHGLLGSTPPDLVVVPGGGWNARADAGAWGEVERGELPRALADLHAAGVRFASVCTRAMLLAAAGLLDGRPAVTHHRAVEDLRRRGADVLSGAEDHRRVGADVSVRQGRVVDDGEVATAGGVTSGLDLGLWLVERTFGRELAERVGAEIEYPPRSG